MIRLGVTLACVALVFAGRLVDTRWWWGQHDAPETRRLRDVWPYLHDANESVRQRIGYALGLLGFWGLVLVATVSLATRLVDFVVS